MKQLQPPTLAKIRRLRNTSASVCSVIALLILTVILLYLSMVALTETVDMNLNNFALENIDTYADRFLFNLFTLALFILAALLWGLLTERVPAKALITLCLLVVTVTGIVFVVSARAAPSNDSLIVTGAAYRASLGDPSRLAEDYFLRFPYQLGYVLYSEIIIRLFHTGNNCIAIEIINVLCLSVSYLAIFLSVRRLYGEGRVLKLCTFFMLIFLPPILFCTLPYGNIPGLMFSTLAVWQVLSIHSEPAKRNWLHAVLAALCIGLAVAIKKNYMIVFAAILIVLVIRIIRRPTLPQAVCALLCAVSVWGISAGAQWQYEKRFGLEFGDGIPMSSWAAMGLNEAFIAPGWYEAKYTVVNFRESGMNPAEANRRSMQVIRERIAYLKENPAYTDRFFSDKIRSEWNEPSYQSIWTTQVRGSYGDRGALASWVCGTGEKALKGWMNAVQQFIFVMSTAGCILLLKRRRITDALFPACVIGGFLYHTVFEAKSQYILTYVVLLLPLAAYGAAGLFESCRNRIKKHGKHTVTSQTDDKPDAVREK